MKSLIDFLGDDKIDERDLDSFSEEDIKRDVYGRDEDGYMNFIDYQDQLIEAEARAFAKLFINEDKKE